MSVGCGWASETKTEAVRNILGWVNKEWKQSCVEQRILLWLIHALCLLKLSLSPCPHEFKGRISIPWFTWGVKSDQLCLISLEASGATGQWTFLFSKPRSSKCRAVKTDILWYFVVESYRLWIPINLCPNPGPDDSEMIASGPDMETRKVLANTERELATAVSSALHKTIFILC